MLAVIIRDASTPLLQPSQHDAMRFLWSLPSPSAGTLQSAKPSQARHCGCGRCRASLPLPPTSRSVDWGKAGGGLPVSPFPDSSQRQPGGPEMRGSQILAPGLHAVALLDVDAFPWTVCFPWPLARPRWSSQWGNWGAVPHLLPSFHHQYSQPDADLAMSPSEAAWWLNNSTKAMAVNEAQSQAVEFWIPDQGHDF